MDSKSSTKLQIYFSGSLRGVEANKETYLKIVEHLRKYGTVLTEHIVNPSIKYASNDNEIYRKDWESFQKADCIVAEVTSPSHGVGIEIGWAMRKENFPILCLSAKKKQYQASALITGCPLLTYREYDELTEAFEIIDEFFKNK